MENAEPPTTGSATPGPPGRIAVVLEPDTSGAAAVRWAVREAARRGAHVHVVLPDDHRHDLACRRSFATAVAVARQTAPDVVVTAAVARGPAERAELSASVDAELVVLPERSPHLDEVVRGAFCPAVVVPDVPATPRPGRPVHSLDPFPVVLAAGPATEPEVIEFAFLEAQARAAAVLAVRTWTDPLIDLGVPLPGRIQRWDAANDQVRVELAQQLSLSIVAHPEVVVAQLVVNDRCAELITAVALHARLLVLGRPARGALLNGVATSPALVLAHRAPCPVIVVPPANPMGGRWLPSRPVRLADLRG
jgi:hypothetical protein